MNEKISIIMSAYKPTREGIFRSIKSVLSQTLTNFEFIIINDDNTLETQNLLNEINCLDNRVKIITNKKNIGLVKSLNKGLKYAEGTIIARIDVDDWWEPEKLERQYKYMLINKLDLLGTATNFVDEQLCLINFEYLDNIKEQLLLGKNPFVHSSVMFRKKDNFFYNTKALYTEDFELWCRYYLDGKIGYLNEKLTYYVVDNSGITGSKRYLMFRNSVEIYKNFTYILLSNEKKQKKLISKPLREMNLFEKFSNYFLNKAQTSKINKNRKSFSFFSFLSLCINPKLIYFILLRKYYNYLIKREYN